MRVATSGAAVATDRVHDAVLRGSGNALSARRGFRTVVVGDANTVTHRRLDRLRIDKRKVGNAKVFRPEGWEVALIVSEEIKNAIEDMGVTGARFEEV